MAKNERIVVEGEIVTDNSVANGPRYTQYAHKPNDSALVGVWLFGVFAVFFSLIPIFGLVVSVAALAVFLLKKVPPILPIVGLVIGSVTTCIFLLLWLVLKALF